MRSTVDTTNGFCAGRVRHAIGLAGCASDRCLTPSLFSFSSTNLSRLVNFRCACFAVFWGDIRLLRAAEL